MLYSMLHNTLSPPQFFFENMLYSIVNSMLLLLFSIFAIHHAVYATYLAMQYSML